MLANTARATGKTANAGSVEVGVTVGVPAGADQSHMNHNMKMGEKKKQGG